jgi:hypothetical protein
MCMQKKQCAAPTDSIVAKRAALTLFAFHICMQPEIPPLHSSNKTRPSGHATNPVQVCSNRENQQRDTIKKSLLHVNHLLVVHFLASIERTLATFFLVMRGRGTAAPEMIVELLLSLCPLSRLEDKEVVAPDRTALAAILSRRSKLLLNPSEKGLL